MSTPDTTVRIVQRLRTADSALAGDGLHVPTFAAQHGLSGKTIERLLSSLTALGCTHTTHHAADGRFVHRYDRGVGPLFAATTGKAGRPRMKSDRTDEIRSLIVAKTDGIRTKTSIYHEVAKELGVGYGTVYRADKSVK